MSHRPGERVGEWLLEELLGEGAFGEVWRSRAQADPSRLAALKLPRDDRGAALLRREGEAQARLASPRFPRVLGVSSDPPYVAFELVVGDSLRGVLQAGRLPFAEARRIARAVLEALAEAHAAGIVHRDVKPENVLVASDGRVFLTDLGLALETEGELSHSLEGDSPLAGSLPYLAPEVREGKPADARSDLYSWGVVVFEMLAGTLPAAAELPSGHGAPRDWDQVYRQACARPEKRFSSAGQALAALDALPLPPEAAKPRPRVDVHALLERAAREEAAFLQGEFMACVTPAGRATARVGGKTYVFDVAGPPGLAVLRATSPTRATIVRTLPRR